MSSRRPTCSPACSGCARAGLASVGVVAIDGTKIAANASMDANRDFAQIAQEILAEATEVDRREDELYAASVETSCPSICARGRDGARLREGERLEREADRALEASADEDDAPLSVELDPQQFVTRRQGRRAWVREGRRALEAPTRARSATDRQGPQRSAV